MLPRDVESGGAMKAWIGGGGGCRRKKRMKKVEAALFQNDLPRLCKTLSTQSSCWEAKVEKGKSGHRKIYLGISRRKGKGKGKGPGPDGCPNLGVGFICLRLVTTN
jgi:hypothetical protein